MIVLVTGGRKYRNRMMIEATLDHYLFMSKQNGDAEFVVVQGGDKGADALAKQWAEAHESDGVRSETVEAEWTRYGKQAGPIRNRKMYDTWKPQLVLVFHDNLDESKGTKDMAEYAESQNEALIVYVEQEAA